MYSQIVSHTGDEEAKGDFVPMVDEDGQTWLCEFCGHRNMVNLEEPEIPKKDTINYILENAAATENKVNSNEEISIVFCVDISGSMCVTKAVDGKFQIKGDRTKEMKDLMKFSDGSDQFAFKDRHKTYISRLQCVQAAIDSQIQKMKTEYPNRKMGLVTFNNDTFH